MACKDIIYTGFTQLDFSVKVLEKVHSRAPARSYRGFSAMAFGSAAQSVTVQIIDAH